MAGVNVKMGVSGVSQFKQDIGAIKQSISTMNADLALIEKQFKATGDAETYMSARTEVLKGKLDAQKSILESAEAALDSMKKNGVDPASKAFQEMQRAVINAKGDILDTQTQLDNVGKSADTADESLKGIGKNVAWENVTDGLDKIISKLESGAKAAINFGKKIARSAMDSTEWADDVMTAATKYGTDAETIQRMRNVAEFIDTEADTIMNARRKLMTGVGKGTKGTMDALEMLGISYDGDAEKTFWEVGEALMQIGDEAERDAAAQALFGQKWQDLVPLFTAGREEYERLMEEQNVLTNEQVERLGEADDAIKRMQQEVDRLKNQFWADNADKITGLLQWILDHKESVVTALGAIAAAFGAIKIGQFALELGKVVDGFKTLWGGAEKKLPTIPGTGTSGGGTGGTGGTSVPKIDAGAMGGLAGLTLLGSSFLWMYDRQQNHQEQVRGSEANLEARTASVEQLLVDYINAQKEDTENLDIDRAEELYNRVQETYDRLMGAEGGADALQAYSDWRQANSYGNMYWEVPEALSRMESNAADLVGDATSDISSAGKDVKDAASEMKRLPQATANAVAGALRGISISLDGQAVGNAVSPYVSTAIASYINP